MNHNLKAQITHMITFCEAFKRACHLAATQDDMKIDKSEEKTLRKINKAADRFLKELNAALKDT